MTNTKIVGRAYLKCKCRNVEKSTSVMVAKILKFAVEDRVTPESTFILFLTELSRTSLHEQLHVFFDVAFDYRGEVKVEHAEELLLKDVAELTSKEYTESFYPVFEWLRENWGELKRA
jgi:hypothetical protein